MHTHQFCMLAHGVSSLFFIIFTALRTVFLSETELLALFFLGTPVAGGLLPRLLAPLRTDQPPACRWPVCIERRLKGLISHQEQAEMPPNSCRKGRR